MYSPTEDAPEASAAPFAAVPVALQPAFSRKGFAGLTSIQQAILAPEVAGRDLQITSQTGSGKTVAIGLAVSPALLTPNPEPTVPKGPLVLVVTPTRELAVQVATELEWLFADLRHVTIDCVTGGTSVSDDRHRLRRPPTVLVGTPGRLIDHTTTGALQLGEIGQLVLDEADQMLDMGFRDELEAILDQLPETRRSILVSATFPPGVRNLTKRYQRDPLHVEGTTLGKANQDIEHQAHLINARDRYGVLVNHLLLATDRRVLVFVRTREDTSTLSDKLEGDGFRALPLSGDLTQAQRTRTLNAFKRGTIQVLVATDVAARGLDIPEVASVVHMEPPVDAAAYTHRSGRTGRAGQKGTSVVLVPRAREGYLRRMLSEAKVAVQWRAVPSAEQVRTQQRARLVEQLQVRLAATADPGTLQTAEELAAAHPPTAVIAALLAELSARAGRQPVEFGTPAPTRREPHAAAPKPAAKATSKPYTRPTPAPLPAALAEAPVEAPREAPVETPVARPATPPPAVAPIDLGSEDGFDATLPAAAEVTGTNPAAPTRERPPTRGKPVPNNGRFVRFRINWGIADGAEPRRILAHVCRRGGIESHQVGAIELDRYESTFAIAEAVATEFAAAVRKRDSRDPHLVIHAAEGVAAQFRAPSHRGAHPRAPSHRARPFTRSYSHPQDRYGRR